MRMYERDKNNPCIIMWSLGNESGIGRAHMDASKELRERDHSRIVHYEGGGSMTSATDIICPMYARIEQIKEMVSRDKVKRPLVLCEYCHAMGNGVGNIDEYWEVFNTHENIQGGFIWDWVDQGLIFKVIKI